jgi:hypothetical protein
MGEDSHVFLIKKLRDENRKCEIVRYRDAAAGSFVVRFRGEFFTHFHAVAVKRPVECGIDCLACQGKFVCVCEQSP